MSGIVCHRCFDLVPFDAVYCASCGARVGAAPPKAEGPHPSHSSMTPGRAKIRAEAQRALAVLDARRRGRVAP